MNVTSPVTKLRLILPASTYSLPPCGRSTLNASSCWEPAWSSRYAFLNLLKPVSICPVSELVNVTRACKCVIALIG